VGLALVQLLHVKGVMTKHLWVGIVLLGGLGLGCSSSNTSAGPSNSSTPPALDRLIEEGDIVWLDDPTLYVLNATRGLSVVGLGNPAAPLLIGRVAMTGTPVELYLHNGYILALHSGLTSSSSTSRLSIVDVRRPEAPTLVGTVGLSGQTTDSRLVGDVLYVASDSGMVIESVNVADPRSPRLVDRLSLPLGSYGSHVLATETVFYVATESYSGTAMGECASGSYDNEGCTTIFAVDISSPVGALRLGASYAMAGMLKDRWGLDAFDGVLRVLVARGGWWTSTGSLSATLRTFRSSSASQLDPLASLSLDTVRLEKVMAVRFDGPKAYVVTFRQTDPLFTIDISNPASPRVAGGLQTPGWLDFIIPRGNRLLGIGREQDTQAGGWRLQASLYDVTNLAAPTLTARIPFGDGYSTLPDQADNLAKVVRVIDELGVLLVPYNSTSVGYSQDTAGGQVEIISFANNTLTTQGRIASTQPIVRAVPLPPVYFAAVTESAVGVIQISPEPAVTGVVDLNQAVTSPAATDGGAHD
jgi:hypothetical protein